MNPDKQAAPEASATKRPYRTPTLVCHGKMSSLTQSASPIGEPSPSSMGSPPGGGGSS